MATSKAVHYDVIVIGSGQGGTPLSTAFAKAGHKTALVEASHIGGCCINEGCTPTKTMIASGKVAYHARRGADFGVHTGDIKIDMEKIRQRKRDIVDSFRGGSEKRLQAAGVDWIKGRATFTGEREIKVEGVGEDGGQRITGDKIFISTGEKPAVPRVDGIETIPPEYILDSTSIQELGVVPKHLIVVGGGYIGLEFGQLFRRLGAEVTILQRGKQLVPREDHDVAAAMLDILKEDGITVHLNTTLSKLASSPSGNGREVTLKGEGPASIQGSHILFAAGRTPNTSSLNLSSTGVEVDSRGYIVVDEQLRTSNPSIWALGDVNQLPAKFTHQAYDDYRIVQRNLITAVGASVPSTTKDRDLTTPYVMYTDPQLAHIGLHLHEARARFPSKVFKTATMPMNYVARALETDESRGLMKAVVDAESKEIVGFTCLGLEGGELMAVVQMAMLGKLKYTQLQDAVFAHPSLAESLNNLWGFLEE